MYMPRDSKSLFLNIHRAAPAYNATSIILFFLLPEYFFCIRKKI